ncbi:hypothetical protein V8E36_002645, partial [Tilletia maclaganii]
MTISAGETPQLAFFPHKNSPASPPKSAERRRRPGEGDFERGKFGGFRGREIWLAGKAAEIPGELRISAESPPDPKDSHHVRVSCHVVGLKKSHRPPALGFRHKIRGVKHCRRVMDGSKATLGDHAAEIGGGRCSFSIVRYRPGEGDCRWIFLLFLPRVSPAFGGREIRPLDKAAEMQRRRGGAWGTPQPSPPTSLSSTSG